MRKRPQNHTQTISFQEKDAADSKKRRGLNLSKNLRTFLYLFIISFVSFIFWKVLKYVAAAYDLSNAVPLVKKNNGNSGYSIYAKNSYCDDADIFTSWACDTDCCKTNCDIDSKCKYIVSELNNLRNVWHCVHFSACKTYHDYVDGDVGAIYMKDQISDNEEGFWLIREDVYCDEYGRDSDKSRQWHRHRQNCRTACQEDSTCIGCNWLCESKYWWQVTSLFGCTIRNSQCKSAIHTYTRPTEKSSVDIYPNKFIRELIAMESLQDADNFLDVIINNLKKNCKDRKPQFVIIGVGDETVHTHHDRMMRANWGKWNDWSGLLAEPLKKNYESVISFYEKNELSWTLEHTAISEDCTNGFTNFHYPCGGPSDHWLLHEIGSIGMDIITAPNIADLMKRDGLKLCTEEVPCIGINQFLEKHGLYDVDYFQIDVEGYEWSILRNWDLKRFRPKVIVYEMRIMASDKSSQLEDLMQHFKENAYLLLTDEVPLGKNDHIAIRLD